MAARRAASHAAHRATHLRDIFDASIEARSDRVRMIVRDILDLGIPSETVTDLYVPEVARRLGAAWVADRLSFVEVTIGTAHLQAIARDLAGAANPREGERCRLAVIVPCNEDHTLGSVVLAGQLRRMGAAVSLHLQEDRLRIGDALATDRPDGVLISVSHADCVRQVAALVEMAHCVLGAAAPVIVGGPLLGDERIDLGRQTRAEHLSSEPAFALRLCRTPQLVERPLTELVR